MNEEQLKALLQKERSSGPVFKTFEIKADSATMEENTLSGNASVMGILDSYSDCIFPGAYKKAIPGFLENGFIPVGHNWSELPIAMPTKAREDGQNLYCEAVFHSHQAAQDARTVCRERLANGLSVGLSVGFMPDYEMGVAWFDDGVEATGLKAGLVYFDSGESMLKFAKSAGYDLKLFDAKGIRACKGYCRGILNISALYEFSVVSIPANSRATATDAKSLDAVLNPKVFPATIREFEDLLRELGASNKQAVDIASVGFAKAMQRESAEATQTTKDADLTRLLLLDSLARDSRLRVNVEALTP